MTKDQIRAIFMANGFTIKEGQTDLKEYVYVAAEALLAASSPATQPVIADTAKPVAINCGECACLPGFCDKEGDIRSVLRLVVNKINEEGPASRDWRGFNQLCELAEEVLAAPAIDAAPEKSQADAILDKLQELTMAAVEMRDTVEEFYAIQPTLEVVLDAKRWRKGKEIGYWAESDEATIDSHIAKDRK